MAYARRSRSGYSRTRGAAKRSTGRRAPARRSTARRVSSRGSVQTVRLELVGVPASSVSRSFAPGVETKPAPKAKF